MEFGIYSKDNSKGFTQKSNRITLRKFILKLKKRCPTSLDIREMQIKITMRYQFAL